MSLRKIAALCLAVALVCAIFLPDALAGGSYKPEGDFADEVDTFYSRTTRPANRQKFFSILLFVVLGGASAYAQLRGIKKVVSMD